MQLAAPPGFREANGISVERLGAAVVLLATRSNNVALNRTLGHGFDQPLTAARLSEVVEHYVGRGISRFLLQWCPLGVPAHADAILGAAGFEPRTRMARMYRAAEPVILPDVPLEIRHVRPDERDLFGILLASAHEGPAAHAPGFSSTIGRRGWQHYVALASGRPVGGAALHVGGEVAWCGLAGTLPEARRQGAHLLLLAAPLNDAAAAGCRWVVCDTMEETPERPNASFRNMRRAGFETAYLRTNYLFDRQLHSGVGPTSTVVRGES